MKVKGRVCGKVKRPVSHRNQEEMGWVKRDSPERPEPRASRSPEGEVSKTEGLPEKEHRRQGSEFIPGLQEFLPTCPTGWPASLGGPSKPVLIPTMAFWGSPLLFRENPKFLSPVSRRVSRGSQHPLPTYERRIW